MMIDLLLVGSCHSSFSELYRNFHNCFVFSCTSLYLTSPMF